ncbi:MAG: response regulator [Candidatus Hydrogenedens sp.]|nr:response regulator [Candidatus Hydrogenedens sp.]
MESTPKYQTSIERKFFTAIFWVGVIPMTLTLIIAYVFAREGQWITTKRNLTTAVRKTTEGVRLSLETRLNFSARVITDPLFSQFCQSSHDVRQSLENKLSEKLSDIQTISQGKTIAFAIFDTEGHILYSTQMFNPGDFILDKWYQKIRWPYIVSISTPPKTENYTLTVAIPIYTKEDNKIVGFLLEVQQATELIDFILSQPNETGGFSTENIYNTIIYIRGNDGIALYKDFNKENKKNDINYEIVDNRLVQRLKRSSNKTEGYITLLRFSSRGKVAPIVMAYQKIYPEYELYFCAYRPLYDIFWFIHFGSILALAIAGFIILFFSLIGYRIVHRNILRPLSLINEGAQLIQGGDLELKLKIDTGDELEEVAKSFNQMASALRKNIYELEASEERYRNLVNSMRDGIYQTTKDGTLTLINPAGAKILGFDSPEDSIGTDLEKLFLNSNDFKELCAELNEKQYLFQYRTWIKPIKGELLCIEISATWIKDSNNNIVGVEGIFRDITKNVLLEKEVQERAERLKAVNFIAQTINSNLEVGKVLENVVKEIKRLIANIDYAIVALLLEGSESSKEQSTAYEILPLFPITQVKSQKSSFYCAEKVLINKKTLHIDYLSSEDEKIASEFPTDIISLIATPLFAEDKIIGILVIGSKIPKAFTIHDVEIVEEVSPHIAVAIRNARLMERLQKTLDEVKKAQQQLNKANEELKTLDEMKTNLLSNVSHELRTPLVSIMGYTDMILSGKTGPITDTQKEYLSISMRNIEKLVNLIENLLDFSKLHKGKEELVFSTFDIVESAEIGLQNIRPMAEPRGIQLILTAETKPILVDGDKGKILQVFNNLLSNAVKFNNNNGTVEVKLKIIEDEVEVSVTDTGIGIPPEAYDKIFTRFYQVDSSTTRKYGGTGIGLSISQDIIRLHGSRIILSSTLGQGTTFSFRLPIHGTKSEVSRKYVSEITPDETHLLVELVTQDRSLSAQIRQWLLEENIDILHASYPSFALSLVFKYNPDCLIIDCEETPLGKEHVNEILENPAISHIPIIIITNNDSVYKQFSEKVIHRLPKQFRKSVLLSAIRYAIKNVTEEQPLLGNEILCVDDDPEILQFMKRCLETAGYKVDTSRSGEEALEKLQTGRFSLLLLDIAMPGLDGWEICRIIKTNSKYKGIRIHIVTAKSVNEDLQKIYEVGAEGLLQKPFKQEELLSIVKTYMP